MSNMTNNLGGLQHVLLYVDIRATYCGSWGYIKSVVGLLAGDKGCCMMFLLIGRL